MKKFFMLLLSLSLAFCLAGFSSSQLEAKTYKKLQIKDSGWSKDEDGYISYAVAIYNPNKSIAIEYPSFKAAAYTSDGKVIDTGEGDMLYIGPKETVYYAGQLDSTTAEPAKVVFKPVKVRSYNYIKQNKNKSAKNFVITSPTETPDEYSGIKYTGIVTNNSKKDVNEVAITVIQKKDGKIVAGSTTYVDDVPKNDNAPFDLTTYYDVDHDSYEMYAQIWM